MSSPRDVLQSLSSSPQQLHKSFFSVTPSSSPPKAPYWNGRSRSPFGGNYYSHNNYHGKPVGPPQPPSLEALSLAQSEAAELNGSSSGRSGRRSTSTSPSPRSNHSGNGQHKRHSSTTNGGFQELKALVSLPFFDNLDSRAARKLAACFERRIFQSGDFIVKQDEMKAGFHVLVRGKVDVLLFTKSAHSNLSMEHKENDDSMHKLNSNTAASSSLFSSCYPSVYNAVTGMNEILLDSKTNPAYFGHLTLVRSASSTVVPSASLGLPQRPAVTIAHRLEPVTVRAAEDGTIVLSISGEGFDQFIVDNPNVRVALEYKHQSEGDGHVIKELPLIDESALPTPPSPSALPIPIQSASASEFEAPPLDGGAGGMGLEAVLASSIPLSANGTASLRKRQLPHWPSSPTANVPSASASAASGSSSSSATSVSPGTTSFSAASSASVPSFSLASAVAADYDFPLEKLKLIVSLRSLPFFAQLGQAISELKLQQLAPLFEFRRCQASECIMREGEPARGFYILLSGRVQVTALRADPSDPSPGPTPGQPAGEPVYLNTLMPGDIAGEIGLLCRVPRTATLTALQSCTFLYLSGSNFATFLSLAPEVFQNGQLRALVANRVGNSLKTLPLFSFLCIKEKGPLQQYREDILEALGPLFTYCHVGPGETVCREGEEGEYLYIIQRGVVAVFCKNRDTLAGGPHGNGPTSTGSSTVPAGALNSGLPGAATTAEEPNVVDAEGNVAVGELHVGDLIGEEVSSFSASSSSGSSSSGAMPRRTCTVRPLSEGGVLLLRLHRRDIVRFLALVPQVRPTLERFLSASAARTLATLPYFRSIRENKPWSKLSILGSMFRFRAMQRGEYVVHEGEEGDTFYVIVEGTVEVIKKIGTSTAESGPSSAAPANATVVIHAGSSSSSGSGSRGSSRSSSPEPHVVLDVLSRGQFIGELALLKRSIRVATVRCREDCLFLFVTKTKFDQLCALAPDVLEVFSSLVTQRTANLLRSIQFFERNIDENKPWSKLELLASLFVYESYDAGVTILKQGSKIPQDKIFVLSVGSVDVATQKEEEALTSRRNSLKGVFPTAAAAISALSSANAAPAAATAAAASGLNSTSSPPPPTTTHVLERGALLNEQSLLVPGAPAESTVTTREPCVFFTLTRDKFQKYCQISPELLEGLKRRVLAQQHRVAISLVNNAAATSPRLTPFKMAN